MWRYQHSVCRWTCLLLLLVIAELPSAPWHCTNGQELHDDAVSWSSWSRCTICCSQFRSRYNSSFSEAELRENRECSGGDCLSHCSLSRWSPWTSCSRVAGSTQWLRQRRRYRLHPSDTGEDCQKENLLEIYLCVRQDVREECGQFGDWSAWSGSCSCGEEVAYQRRARQCVTSTSAAAVGSRDERPCFREQVHRECDGKLQCLIGAWSQWTCTADCSDSMRSGNIAQGQALRKRPVGFVISNSTGDSTTGSCLCPHRQEHAGCAQRCRVDSFAGGGARGLPRRPINDHTTLATSTSAVGDTKSKAVSPSNFLTPMEPGQISSNSILETIAVQTNSSTSWNIEKLWQCLAATLAVTIVYSSVLTVLWIRERKCNRRPKVVCSADKDGQNDLSGSSSDHLDIDVGHVFINPMYRGTPPKEEVSEKERAHSLSPPERDQVQPVGMETSSEESSLSLHTIFYRKPKQEHSVPNNEQAHQRSLCESRHTLNGSPESAQGSNT